MGFSAVELSGLFNHMNIYIVGATYSTLTGETERPPGCDDLLPVSRTYTSLKAVFARDAATAEGEVRIHLDRSGVDLISITVLALRGLLDAGGGTHRSGVVLRLQEAARVLRRIDGVASDGWSDRNPDVASAVDALLDSDFSVLPRDVVT